MLKSALQIPATFDESGVLLPDMPDFDLAQTLDCGQAFRWEEQMDGSFIGIAHKKRCRISREGDAVRLWGISRASFEQAWHPYFDLGRDYAALKRRFSSDPALARAVEYAPGIRVLRQEPWEALCSFIISQNNHVKRIKGIVSRFCELLGEPAEGGGFAFPSPEAVASCSPADLAPLRAGFRARYLVDAAQKVVSGQVDLEACCSLPLPEARAMLTRITGVGVKVADCALLYGCGRVECFPIDVWMRRVMERLYPDGLPDCARGYEGIAQQYLFHYARTTGLGTV